MRCGPRDSYRYVASLFQCPEGGNPFGGDEQAAARARSGSQQRPGSSHMLDTYEVPCRGGGVTVYVDMYGCDYQAPASASHGALGSKILAAFDAAEDVAVLETCAGVDRREELDAAAICGVVVPASLTLVGEVEAAERHFADLCSRLPPQSEKSDIRALHVSLYIAAIGSRIRGPGVAVSEDDAIAVAARIVQRCEVPAEGIYEVRWEDFAR